MTLIKLYNILLFNIHLSSWEIIKADLEKDLLVSPIVVDIIEFLIFIAESLNLNEFFKVALNGEVGEFGLIWDLSKSDTWYLYRESKNPKSVFLPVTTFKSVELFYLLVDPSVLAKAEGVVLSIVTLNLEFRLSFKLEWSSKLKSPIAFVFDELLK